MKRLACIVLSAVLLLLCACSSVTTGKSKEDVELDNRNVAIAVKAYSDNNVVAKQCTNDVVALLAKYLVSAELKSRIDAKPVTEAGEGSKLPAEGMGVLWGLTHTPESCDEDSAYYEYVGKDGVFSEEQEKANGKKTEWYFKDTYITLNKMYINSGNDTLTQLLVISGNDRFRIIAKVYWKNGKIVNVEREMV